jgi:serine O-acetyltransferase
MKRFKDAFQQIGYLFFELNLIVNRKYWRWLTCWFGSSAGIIVSYRLDRFFYLLLGNAWALVRVVFFPLFLVLRLLSAPHEIHYRAQIGKGLKILHGSLGTVVSGWAVIGNNLILTGGNCIGERKSGELRLGDDVTLGANAVVLGPVRIGNRVQIAAGAVVAEDADDDEVLVGASAHHLRKSR